MAGRGFARLFHVYVIFNVKGKESDFLLRRLFLASCVHGWREEAFGLQCFFASFEKALSWLFLAGMVPAFRVPLGSYTPGGRTTEQFGAGSFIIFIFSIVKTPNFSVVHLAEGH